jgi:hypothetical protein
MRKHLEKHMIHIKSEISEVKSDRAKLSKQLLILGYFNAANLREKYYNKSIA